MTADELVVAIEQHTQRAGRKNGKHVRLLCPAHDDHHPSLDVAEGADGRPLVVCRSHGCTYEQVLAVLGLEPSSPDEPLEVYLYVDERGHGLIEVGRFAGKRFLQRRAHADTWKGGIGDTRRVLYRLPAVLAAVAAGETVYVVEGEKDVHALERLGAVATCNPMGAGKWYDDYAESLRGANVVVVADRDDTGEAHARRIARSLEHVDAAFVLRQAAVERKGADVSDHLAAGLTLDQLVELAPRPPELELRLVTAADFAAVDERGAEAVLGTADGPLIPEGGNVMVYGDGGVGKTTLCVDLAYHLAAGDTWLGLPVPRPTRVLLVENEGPRPLFRRKIARKQTAWEGSPIGDRLRVLEHPWAAFSFADDQQRGELADAVSAFAIDVVIVGPVTSAGMDAAGTMQEVRAFAALVDDVRDRSGRPVAIVLVHHENKGGQVSGAWEGVGDTLVHVTQQGHGRSRVYFQKARWASNLHATALQLRWADAGDTFELDERPELDDDQLAEMILEQVAGDPGVGWTKVREAVKGVHERRRAAARDLLLKAGRIVNVVKQNGELVALDHCPERRPAHLYPADDPTIRHLWSHLGPGENQTGSAGAAQAAGRLVPGPRLIGDQGQGDQPGSPVDEEELERLAELARGAE